MFLYVLFLFMEFIGYNSFRYENMLIFIHPFLDILQIIQVEEVVLS